MGIVSYCPNGHRTKLKDRFAGLRVRCPECGAKFFVTNETSPAAPAEVKPAADSAPEESGPQPPTTPVPAAIAEAADASWCIAVPGGEPSPPQSPAEMLVWLRSGKATGNELVWRSDWADWRPLGTVFADVLGGSPQ